MEYLIVALAACLASGLTLFSGFGLGTLLLPAFVVFFPVPTAVAVTAVVHFLNNLFKLGLFGRYADRGLVLRFGLPAVVAAFPGAAALVRLTEVPPLTQYRLFGQEAQLTVVNLVIAGLMLVFAGLELMPIGPSLKIPKTWLPVGGLMSGFFGGLSGHQGALRAAFLLRSVDTKEQFLGTGIVIACLVDVARLGVYGTQLSWTAPNDHQGLLVTAVLSAFAGALIANRMLPKVQMRAIRVLVAVLLAVMALGIGLGLL
ncbi:MAG: TSUP family transporter [Nitrospirales bacterium]